MFILPIILFVIVLFIVFWFFKSNRNKNEQDFRLDNLHTPNQYKNDSRSVVIACYFNPQNNPYRRKAFNLFYDKIKHLNHRIIECVI